MVCRPMGGRSRAGLEAAAVAPRPGAPLGQVADVSQLDELGTIPRPALGWLLRALLLLSCVHDFTNFTLIPGVTRSPWPRPSGGASDAPYHPTRAGRTTAASQARQLESRRLRANGWCATTREHFPGGARIAPFEGTPCSRPRPFDEGRPRGATPASRAEARAWVCRGPPCGALPGGSTRAARRRGDRETDAAARCRRAPPSYRPMRGQRGRRSG